MPKPMIAIQELLKKLSEDILQIIDKVSQLAVAERVNVFLVGGFVRDLILGHPVEDIDFVIEGDAIAFAQKFKKKFGGTKVVSYGRFGTAMLNYREFKLEFVTAREEWYQPQSRKPNVKEASIQTDLSRRDFTINAMAVRLGDVEPQLVDPFNGMQDLKAGIIRTPLEPAITFFDDPLRILRAIRFASRYHYQIESQTFQGIVNNKERLKIVSTERITDELSRMFSIKNPYKTYVLLKQCQLLGIVFPEYQEQMNKKTYFDNRYTWDEFITKVLNNNRPGILPPERIWIYFHAWLVQNQEKLFRLDEDTVIFGKQINFFRTIGHRMKLPNETINKISHTIMFLPFFITVLKKNVNVYPKYLNKLLFYGGENHEFIFETAYEVVSAFEHLPPEELKKKKALFEEMVIEEKLDKNWSALQPQINGDEIRELLPDVSGIQIGVIKKKVMAAILDFKLENRNKDIKKWIRQMYIR